MVAHVAPMAVMLAAALGVFHRLEGRPLTWTAFSKQFCWVWPPFLALIIAYGVFSQLGSALGGLWLNPVAGTNTSVEQLLDNSDQGRCEIVFFFVLTLTFNVAGEELCPYI